MRGVVIADRQGAGLMRPVDDAEQTFPEALACLFISGDAERESWEGRGLRNLHIQQIPRAPTRDATTNVPRSDEFDEPGARLCRLHRADECGCAHERGGD